MNILLTAVNAKYIHSNLAVRSLRAYAAKCGYRVQIAEYTINQRAGMILREIYLKRPDVLVFSCYIWNIELIKEVADEFHKLCPGVPIWAGGPEVSYDAEQFLRENPAFAGVMTGEGERAFSRLCGYYERDLVMDEIDGIVCREPNGTIVARPCREKMALDEIPFCYDDMEELSHRIIYYESSRGCPLSCSYCLSSAEESVRFRSLPLVFGELQFFLDRKVSQVKFVDRTFNCNHVHAQAVWHYIREHDNGITNFHFEIAADLLNEEELDLLASMRPGLIQLEIGVQTTNFETIREIRRSMRLSRVEETVERVRKGRNIHQHLDLIAGLPMEGYWAFQRSFDEVYAMRPDQLQLGFLKVLKGSYLCAHAGDYGLVYRTKAPYEVLGTDWLSYDDVLRIHMVEEMLEIHYNSGQFLTALAVLEHRYDSAFRMFLELAYFYRGRGYANVSHSRVRRAEIFLEFAVSVDGKREKLYREALIFDLYRIEKSKSRPAWARDLAPFRERTARWLREQGYESRYCHLEPFFCLDIESRNDGTPTEGKEKWVLFDYGQRDPLTNEARILEVSV